MSRDASPRTGESALRPAIGVFLGVLLVINATIGTGIFKTPAKVARLSGSLPAALAVWVLGGAIALAGALSLAELSAAMPRAGGLYEILRRTWGPTVAFFYGWAKLTLLIPSAVGSFAKLAAESLASFFGWPANPSRDAWVSLGLIAVATAANLVRVRASAVQQAVVTAAKYGGVVLLALLGLCFTPVAALPGVESGAPEYLANATVLGCFTALVSVMWTYDGWADLTNLAAEIKDPARTLPRALILGTAAIVVVYLAANLGYARALGLEGLRGATSGANMVAARLATATLGARGRQLLAILIAVSCIGGCMSSLLTGPRVFVPMATDGLFFRGLGKVTAGTAIPARAVLVSAALGGAYVMFRSFEQLSDAFVVGYFPFYMLAVSAVIRLRRTEPDLVRPFRVPGYPLVPALFLLGAAGLLFAAFADADRTALFAGLVVAAGIPVHKWMSSRH
jgi:basic amino acid/polyamine antiporter, APA family